MKKIFKYSGWMVLVGFIAFVLFTDHTTRGLECKESISPGDEYIAEVCGLRWVSGGQSTYVGRLYSAKTGAKLAQRVFDAPEARISWSDGVCVPDPARKTKECFGPSVGFTRGETSAGDPDIPLPPSQWDRLLAARPTISY